MLRFFSKKEYQEIADLFRLGTIHNLKQFTRGYQTPKVVVATPRGRFVIATHNFSRKKAAAAGMRVDPRLALMHEISLLNHIKSLPVPRYLKSRKGNYVEDFGAYSVSTYRFIEGRQPHGMNAQMIRQLGEFVGAFHKLGIRYKNSMRGRRKFYNLSPKVVALMYRHAKKQTNPELRKVVEEVRLGVGRSRLPKGLPKGPVHVDIKPENELFAGEKLTGVIDFGNAYKDAFILDVGKALMWNCVKKGRLDVELATEFLNGYAKKRVLSDSEMRNLHRAIRFAIYSHLWVDLYHVPIGYVPASYALFLVRTFLPVVHELEKQGYS